MASNQVFAKGFFRDKSLDYETRVVLGRAVHGGSDVGEVLATVNQVGDHAAWRTQWERTATRVQAAAEALRDGGDPVGAGSAFLRAANYWACVVDALTETDDAEALKAAFRTHRACWDGFVDASGGAHVRVDVPYDGGTLPGYLLRPDDSGVARPTLVMTNGSDGAISGMWGDGAAGAVARGWNAFVYDGPGQQSMLFERGIPLRPDWEAVLTPVVDALVARPDVDADHLTAYGISQAGYWVTRALAYEHRFVAAVVDPGVVDVSTSWTKPIGKSMLKLLEKGDRKAFNRDMGLAAHIPSLHRTLAFRSRPYAKQDDWFDLYNEVREYALDSDVTDRISTPVMITNPEDEQFWPGQAAQLADMLGERAHLVPFTADEGANFHCQPLARQLTDERMFDWLGGRLNGGRHNGN